MKKGVKSGTKKADELTMNCMKINEVRWLTTGVLGTVLWPVFFGVLGIVPLDTIRYAYRYKYHREPGPAAFLPRFKPYREMSGISIYGLHNACARRRIITVL